MKTEAEVQKEILEQIHGVGFDKSYPQNDRPSNKPATAETVYPFYVKGGGRTHSSYLIENSDEWQHWVNHYTSTNG